MKIKKIFSELEGKGCGTAMIAGLTGISRGRVLNIIR
jgi:hypothetical protein